MSGTSGRRYKTKALPARGRRKFCSKRLDFNITIPAGISAGQFCKPLTSDYQALSGGSAFKEAVLSKIVDYLTTTYLIGEDTIYIFEELLGNAGLGHIVGSVKQWLADEGLAGATRVKCDQYLDGVTRYSYQAPLPCTDKTELLELLKKHRDECLGGILEDDVIASVPHAERVISSIEEDLCIFERSDQRRIFYYSPREPERPVESWLKNLAESVSVEGYTEEKIEVDLTKSGIRTLKEMHRAGCSQQGFSNRIGDGEPAEKRRKIIRRSTKVKFRDNEHVADLLVYDLNDVMP